MMFRPALLIATFAGCFACGQIPDIGDDLSAADRAALYPSLLPIDGLIGGGPAVPQITESSVKTLDGRIASLRNRAARLSGPVVDAPTRARMRAAVARAALR